MIIQKLKSVKHYKHKLKLLNMVAAKKPLTPFFRFCADKREEHAKKSDSKLSAKELGEKWRGT